MPRMRDKIKNLFNFIGRAWRGGIRGKFGVFFAAFALLAFIRIFFGEVNVTHFVTNIWHLSAERTELAAEEQKLQTIRHHIQLLKNYSPDYVEELGLRYLNVGDAEFKILKI
ncbi:MAG: hypothetical protein J6T27_02660 [Alphaproteobacteria bacterium]|jgi:hypothetical protein|nr:hypothetical protein [Alphaproteobacteria bacterium]